MRLLPLTLAVALLAGCASAPPPVAAVSAVTPAPAEPSKRPGAPPGYKQFQRNGVTLYCTKVAYLGTKFKQEVCMTQDEYDEVQRRGESVRQDLRQATKMCGGGSGFGSCSGA